MLTIAAVIVTILPMVGFAPLGVRIDVRSAGYEGAICLTVDGPEFHRSCWGRSRTSAPVKTLTYVLYNPGMYSVYVEDKDGSRQVGVIKVVDE
jgi:hypothetical protein